MPRGESRERIIYGLCHSHRRVLLFALSLSFHRCFRTYRSDQGIAQFKRSLLNANFNLRKWRETVEGTSGFEEGLKILDDYGGDRKRI